MTTIMIKSRPAAIASAPAPQSGFALVVVILVLLLATVLAAEMTFAVRTGTLEGFNLRQRLVGRALAQGAINQALFELLDTPLDLDTEDERRYLGREEEGVLATGRLRYVVVNESGKIDLNGADRSLVTTFADYIGLDEEGQAILADSLEDWRDADNLHRLQGAEDDYYQELQPPYRARHGRFTSVSELALVRGATAITERFRLADLFTVHNPSGKINFNSLTPAMLAFVCLDDADKMALYHELRAKQGDLTALEARAILGEERYGECADFLTYNNNKVPFFTITATGYAGRQPEPAEEIRAQPGTRVTVLFEKKGLALRYYGWQEEWS
ncbi:MAG: hypothetical protein C0613_00880 [Desulfobulbaceae bacterium]|nr:MAG: hypothetical protein C0613_00880 [Desulfobulbaceae bacterium]